MLPKLTQRLLGEWKDLFPDTRRPGNIRYLGIPGSIEGGTATFLGFGDTRNRPDFAVKVHRNRARGALALEERNNLEQIRNKGGRLAASVPRPILCDAIGGSWMLVVSMLDGRPMGVRMTSGGMPDGGSAGADFETVSDWLSELHRMTLDCEAPAQAVVQARTAQATQACLEHFPLSTGERERVQQVEKALPALLEAGVVLGHGDFCRHNILVTGMAAPRGIGVIDWTQSERHSLIGGDLFFFLATYFLQVRTRHGIDGFLSAFEQTFFRGNAFSDLVRDCVRHYCARAGIDPSTVRDLFALFLLRQAADYNDMIRRCARRSGLPRLPAYLAAIRNATYEEALREQLWIRFFQLLVCKESHCVV